MHIVGDNYDIDRTMVDNMYVDQGGTNNGMPYRLMARLKDGNNNVMSHHSTREEADRALVEQMSLLRL